MNNKQQLTSVNEVENELDAQALNSNQQLLEFDIRSKNVNWSEHVVPLQPRGPPVYLHGQFASLSNYRELISPKNRRQVLVCHDLMGNYLEDKYFNSSKKFDGYRFYHWSGVDVFCYFSHHYITIPPSGWINAAHKHGVRIIGTFITENKSGYERLHEVLRSKEMINAIVDAMVRLCKHFCFEGWLVNVECQVNADALTNLCYFLDKLCSKVKNEVPHGTVLWYDSVIETGVLQWQNELNERNLRYYMLTHGMLINYGWNDGSMKMTRDICEKLDEPLSEKSRVFFGIDIFGRGQIGKFQSRKTLERIARENFSVGIFAPGWTYETLRNYGFNLSVPEGSHDMNVAFLERNEKFWWSLWDFLGTHPYTAMPFYTDFCLGSGKRVYKFGVPVTAEPFFNLNRQSLQPSVPIHDMALRCYDKAFNGGSCLEITYCNTAFRIIVSDFCLNCTGLVFAYAYNLEYEQPRDSNFDIVLRVCNDSNSGNLFLFLGDYNNEAIFYMGRCYVSPFENDVKSFLDGNLICSEIPTTYKAGGNGNRDGWRTRYYIVEFDDLVQIKDIGVLFRKTPNSLDKIYLGALYLNEFKVDTVKSRIPDKCKIPAYKDKLFH